MVLGLGRIFNGIGQLTKTFSCQKPNEELSCPWLSRDTPTMPSAERWGTRLVSPQSSQGSASATGWTNAYRPGATRVPPPPYGDYAGLSRRPLVCYPLKQPGLQHRRACATPLRRPTTTLGTPPGHHWASARQTPPLAGVSLRCGPHAAGSPTRAGGGAPPRGMTSRHTRSCPQAGPRSGCASPRWAQAVCQSSTTGTTTGGCPTCVRQGPSPPRGCDGTVHRSGPSGSGGPAHGAATAAESPR